MPSAAQNSSSTVKESLAVVGGVVCVAFGALVVFTLVSVWTDGSKLSGLYDDFRSDRNDRYLIKERLTELERQVKPLVVEHDKEHPDAKIAYDSISGGVFYPCGTSNICRAGSSQ